MYDLETLDQSRIGDFATLICPEGRAQLEQLPPQTAVVGVLARLRDQAVGLALSGVYPRSGSAWVISLYVDPASRNQGLGTALLGKSEEEVKKRECLKMSLSFKHHEPEILPLKRVLMKCGWDQPRVRGYHYETTVERFLTDLPWARRSRKFPYHAYIFPWRELTPEEKQKLKEEEGPDSWRAVGTSPFFFEGKFEPQTSLGLRVGEEVVGWMINHQIEPDTILYGSYFVRPKYRGKGLSIGLLLESVKLQKKAGIPNITWYVEATNKAVRKLYQKMVGPCVTLEEEWWVATKTLSES